MPQYQFTEQLSLKMVFVLILVLTFIHRQSVVNDGQCECTYTATQMHWRWMMANINREDRWRMEKGREERQKRWKTNRHELHTVQWTLWRTNTPNHRRHRHEEDEEEVGSKSNFHLSCCSTANNGNTWNVNERNENNLRESEPGEFHEQRTIQHHRDPERECKAKGVREKRISAAWRKKKISEEFVVVSDCGANATWFSMTPRRRWHGVDDGKTFFYASNESIRSCSSRIIINVVFFLFA